MTSEEIFSPFRIHDYPLSQDNDLSTSVEIHTVESAIDRLRVKLLFLCLF
jgi:hypothetical protein